jgi:hypothetical protein
MTRILGFGILLLGLLVVLPAQVQSQAKKNGNNNVAKATAQDYKNLERYKEFDNVTIVSASATAVTVRVADRLKVQATGKYGTSIKTTPTFKEYEFDVADGVVVRKKFVMPDYDDKGNFKANEEQTKELRRNGFIVSKIEDIQSGNYATLYFAPAKKTSDKDKKDDIDSASRRSVNKIVLIGEGKGAVAGSNSAPPKKKKDT